MDAMPHRDRRVLALVQRRILALPVEARKSSSRASEQLHEAGHAFGTETLTIL